MTSHLLTGLRPYGEDATDILITEGTIAAIGPEAAAQAPEDATRHDRAPDRLTAALRWRTLVRRLRPGP